MARTVYDIPTPTTPIERAFALQNNVIISAVNPYRGAIPPVVEADSPVGKSSLGTPVYSDLTFDGGSYIDDAGNTIELDTINFQTVIMIIDQAKNIVRTSVAGADGTVKEYIGMDDYRVTVNGLITGGNNLYPIDVVGSLVRTLEAPVSIDITSNYLAQFGITKAVVSDYVFPQIEGSNSLQPFSITLLSDKSIEAIILQ